MTKVLATGVFNILHPGHLLFLNEARKLGDELDVIVSSDEIASKLKERPLLPEDQRAEMVGALKPVDKVFVGDKKDTLALLPVIKPDVVALGHDQDVDENDLQSAIAARGLDTQVVRVKRNLNEKFTSSSKIAKFFCK
jgi:FAD synthetase